MPDFAPAPYTNGRQDLARNQANHLDESNFNFEVGDADESRHVNYQGKADSYAMPQSKTLVGVKQT